MIYAINHCGFTNEVEGTMSPEDFKEAVMERAGQMIRVATGQASPREPHKLAAIELVATAVANHVIAEGARIVAKDLKVDLEKLQKLAASSHISSC